MKRRRRGGGGEKKEKKGNQESSMDKAEEIVNFLDSFFTFFSCFWRNRNRRIPKRKKNN